MTEDKNTEEKRRADLTLKADFVKGLFYINLTASSSVGAYVFSSFDSIDKFRLVASVTILALSLATLIALGFAYMRILKKLRS